MTVLDSGRPQTPLDIAKRLDTFKDGTFYITAGGLPLASGGLAAVMVANPDGSDSVMGLTALGLLVGAPVLYGLFFGNGRALTGTRLVRVKNGRRIGVGACWAILVRTVLFPLLSPLLFTVLFSSAFSGRVGVEPSRRPHEGQHRRRRHPATARRRVPAPQHARLGPSAPVGPAGRWS